MDDVRTRYGLEADARATDSSRIRRGKRLLDGLPVVVKVPRKEYPSAAELAQIRHEYALLCELSDAPVVRALELVRVNNAVGLVMEDVGSRSFDRLLAAGGLELGRFLRLARAATEALAAVHARGVLHKDIKPHHFFSDAEEKRVVLIDFGIATAVRKEEQQPLGLDALEGTLSYIAPEQTGRMNRAVDRRSDLYSLGVMLYELATGVLPFASADPLELVHCHIARLPRPPADVKPMPRVVSDIILRLLQKVPEQRYQTATGLLADLVTCEATLGQTGHIEPFELGRHDHSSELCMPQKLYGRHADVARLGAALGRARAGTAELVLISGGAGIGKSALVQELHKELALAGHFVSGKFDQFNRTQPYSAVARAAGELVRAELAGSSEQLAAWKAELLAAVGQNGRVLVDIVPELELVIGLQPPVALLGPMEAQNRFESSFQRFMVASASAERPLVVFLDDLQWADSASLRLLSRILQNPEQRHLLVVASYRDNELTGAHPLSFFIDELTATIEVSRVRLEPLAASDVGELLADTFPVHAEPIAPLAEVVMKKTLGNPFFISQFLDTAYRDGLIRFDARESRWTWQLDAIERAAATANVVDLVLAKLQRLDADTQSIASLAACVGHRFDSRQLAAISGRTPGAVARALWQAVREGFVVPLGDEYRLVSHELDASAHDLEVAYRFTHDRVQQAAYALIPEAERGPIHLRIGRQLLARAGASGPSDDVIFDVVAALNAGRGHIESEAERRSLASLDVRAARRAKAACAPATASELSDIALELLGEDAWQVDYALARAAHGIRAECSHLTGNDAAALDSIAALKAHGRTLVERVEAGNLEVMVLTHQGRLVEASASSIEVLRELGVAMPDPQDKGALGQAIGREFGAYQAALAGRSIESLAELPKMSDPEKLALIGTLFAAIPAAFQWNPELMVLMVLMAVRLPIEHGTAPLSAFFYEQYGIVHTVVTGDHDTAYRFGQLGLRLDDDPERQPYTAAVHFIFAAFNSHFKRPLAECLDAFQTGVARALDCGDHMHGAYCMSLGSAYRFYAGEPLERLALDLPGLVQNLTARRDVINTSFLSVVVQSVRCLRGEAAALGAFDDEAQFEASAPPPVLAMYGAHKAMLRFLAGDAPGALAATERFHPLPVLFYNVEYSLYRGLALAELARGAVGEERAALEARLRAECDAHARWAAACPENFAHRHALLSAELHAVSGRSEDAMAQYERAISLATAHGFVQHLALASELCARFHHAAGRLKVARTYLLEASYHYERWGASAKVERLARQYSDVELSLASRDVATATRHLATRTRVATATVAGDGGLDLMSAMRATQAIASELDLSRLVERLLRILVENAGAQSGCLILGEPRGWCITATFRVDPERVEVGLSEPVETSARLARSVVQYVARSKEPVVLDDAAKAQRFARDEYLQRNATRSLSCLPLLHQGELSAILYLENAAVSGAFTAARLERLQFLGSHAAVAIENAKLYGEVQAATRRLEEANDTLEQKVRERTRELESRNADMRRVLDNVTQGLLSIDVQGRVGSERSATVERWFGALRAGAPFADEMAAIDPRFAAWFANAFTLVTDGVLILELAVDQLPSKLIHGEREYRVGYSPILSGEALSGLLIVIDDVTDAVRRARAEAEQKEQLALCQKLAQDRAALNGFFEEGTVLVAAMQAAGEDRALLARLLHTLKGNASLMGLGLLVEHCHRAEDLLGEHGPSPELLEPVSQRWAALLATRDLLLGERTGDRVDVGRAELEALLARIEAGAAARDVAVELEAWLLEPVQRPLARLGTHANALAARLGKAKLELEIAAGGVLTDERKARPLWAVLVHLVRNAVDHGFETASERAEHGKPPRNRLRASARLDGRDFVLELADDGRGIDWARVRTLAQARGLPSETRRELFEALISPGMSTRGVVTDTSGRGVGLDAVVREVQALGGTVSVESEPARGCTWQLRIPRERLGARLAQPDSARRPRGSAASERRAGGS